MLLSLWQCVYDELNTRIVIFQACVLFYIQIHVLYIYYIIELIIDWILTCWRSNWLKISNKIIQIILLFIPRPILRLFPHHKLQQTKLLLCSRRWILYRILDSKIDNLKSVCLSFSLSLSSNEIFVPKGMFLIFFFPPTIQIRLSGRKTIEEALETISFDPKFHDSLARRHLASCLSDLKIITSGDNSRPVSWGYMTCARACTRELREM